MYDKTLRLTELDWSRHRFLVHKELRDDPDEYLRRVGEGLRHAESFLSAVRSPSHLIDPETLRGLHKLAFARVYPFAGSFRERGDEGPVLSTQSAYHSRIGPELARLSSHVDKALGRASAEEERASAIALYHAQVNRIQPFPDGTGRVARRILVAQGRLILGKDLQPVLDREAYLSALAHGQKTGDLRSLSYLTTEVVPRSKQCDYHMELWPVTFAKRSPDGRSHLIRCKDQTQALMVETHTYKELVEMREKFLSQRMRAKGLDREI